MKAITIIILISLVGCKVTYETKIKLDVQKNTNHKQRIDSLQLIKNNIRPPLKW